MVHTDQLLVHREDTWSDFAGTCFLRGIVGCTLVQEVLEAPGVLEDLGDHGCTDRDIGNLLGLDILKHKNSVSGKRDESKARTANHTQFKNTLHPAILPNFSWFR